jgi:hypothetical protein
MLGRGFLPRPPSTASTVSLQRRAAEGAIGALTPRRCLPPPAACRRCVRRRRAVCRPLPAGAADVIERKKDEKSGRVKYYVHYLDCEHPGSTPQRQSWPPPPVSVPFPFAPLCCCCCCCCRCCCCCCCSCRGQQHPQETPPQAPQCPTPAAPHITLPLPCRRQAAGRVGASGAGGQHRQGCFRRGPAPGCLRRRSWWQRRPGAAVGGSEDDAAPEAAVHRDTPRARRSGGASTH